MQRAQYDPSELISIPSDLENLEDVKRELSQATYTRNLTGKIVVNKSPEGSSSPNLADSIVICYCPTREYSILDVL